MNKRKVGAAGEQLAAKYLTEHGMKIIAFNFRCRQGEIDLIGYHQAYLVFVEVKYRTGTEKGYAIAAVGHAKQRKICQVADYYRFIHGLGESVSIRYDVVGIQDGKVEWIQNAFSHIFAHY